MTAPALNTADPVQAVVLRHLTWEQERATIRPLTLDGALAEYAANVAAMSDERLTREVARVEALPGSGFRRLACTEFDRRHPTTTTGGTR